MSLAMFNFGKRLFTRNGISSYTNNDIMVLNEYRTIVPNGAFKTEIKDVELSEIDITKAFTYAFSKITKIPVFNVFDKWLNYDGREIEDFTLYSVEGQ